MFKEFMRLAPMAIVLSCLIGFSGCTSDHIYVSGTPAESILDIETPLGQVRQIQSPAGGATIVGVAYQETTDRLFVRVVPGVQLREVDRQTGNIIRNFTAQGVTPGCGGRRIEFDHPVPVVECGLAVRFRDGHLFLDHPTGNPITETDQQGNRIRDITLQNPRGIIGGIGYDQVTDHLYILFITTSTIAEVDLDGIEIRSFQPQSLIHPEGLSIGSERRELYIPLINATDLGVFDLEGRLIRSHSMNRTGLSAGIGAGRRR